MIKFVLASGSPRRSELLANIGVTFEVRVSNADETVFGNFNAEELVMELSRRKATATKCEFDECIIAADTVVVHGNKILGKPSNFYEAYHMLKSLSEQTHRVFTGVTVSYMGNTVSKYEVTDVTMRKITDEEINEYIKTEPPLDKAGAYGIQGKAALFVRSIKGDYFNVMGLPLCLLGEIMKKDFGINLLNSAVT